MTPSTEIISSNRNRSVDVHISSALFYHLFVFPANFINMYLFMFGIWCLSDFVIQKDNVVLTIILQMKQKHVIQPACTTNVSLMCSGYIWKILTFFASIILFNSIMFKMHTHSGSEQNGIEIKMSPAGFIEF